MILSIVKIEIVVMKRSLETSQEIKPIVNDIVGTCSFMVVLKMIKMIGLEVKVEIIVIKIFSYSRINIGNKTSNKK